MVKKLLGIVVLGLLLSGNAYAELSYVCIYPDDKKEERYTFLIENGKLYLEGHFQKTKYLKTSSSKAEFLYESGISEVDGVTNKLNWKTEWITNHKINLKTGSAIETTKYVTKYFDTSGKITRTKKEKSKDILMCSIIANSGSSGSGSKTNNDGSFLKKILKMLN